MTLKWNGVIRYAITDGSLGLYSPQRMPDLHASPLFARCQDLVSAGLDFLLIREKTVTAEVLLRFTQAVVEAYRRTSTRILVARRPDVALAAAAHGVHLTSSPAELTPAQVHAVFPAAVISRSCHTPDEVRAAAAQGVDTILFGPVFGKVVDGLKVSTATGLPALREACAAAGRTPVLAIGGVTSANTPQCMAAGAAGFAAIRHFFDATPRTCVES